MKRGFCVLVLLLMASGCAVQTAEIRTATLDEQMVRPAPDYSSGSIWQASSGSIVEDFKARRLGDIITIVITENASASKAASTDTSRSTAVSAGIPNFMGLEGAGFFKNNLGGDMSKLLCANTDSTYKGAGTPSRLETLNA
jgi:flagellar L-ring protein precursor FlgH